MQEGKQKIQHGLTTTYQNEMQEELLTDRFVSVDISDVLDFNFASDVAVRRRRNGQNP